MIINLNHMINFNSYNLSHPHDGMVIKNIVFGSMVTQRQCFWKSFKMKDKMIISVLVKLTTFCLWLRLSLCVSPGFLLPVAVWCCHSSLPLHPACLVGLWWIIVTCHVEDSGSNPSCGKVCWTSWTISWATVICQELGCRHVDHHCVLYSQKVVLG